MIDPGKQALLLLDMAKKDFEPEQFAQAVLLDAEGTANTMIAIDPGFFVNAHSRRRLYDMLRQKVQESDAVLFALTSDGWGLKNRNIELFKNSPPPEGSNVEWQASHGYGDLQNILMVIVQTRLGSWVAAQSYDVVDEKVSWLAEPACEEADVPDYTRIFPKSSSQSVS